LTKICMATRDEGSSTRLFYAMLEGKSDPRERLEKRKPNEANEGSYWDPEKTNLARRRKNRSSRSRAQRHDTVGEQTFLYITRRPTIAAPVAPEQSLIQVDPRLPGPGCEPL
jgi:hypothetical protein